ncbi:MAG: phosphoribosylformylglycinamidine synthase subunit PurQ [Candidatus Riflebacteria bacterium]|nr:phosphoribosylformylglycinamidine synthase subunit PurQ [Candidatus Riflebacteria bacterium]
MNNQNQDFQNSEVNNVSEHKQQVKILVVTGFGINCEEETAAAYRMSGANAYISHLNDLFSGKIKLGDFDLLHLPGGFSFGDDLGSGKVLADKLKFKHLPDGVSFFSEIKKFLAEGKFIFGICNGFQALVKLGILPNISGNFEQEVTLTSNSSGHFEDRWCILKRNRFNTSPFLSMIENIELPVRHGEGRLLFSNAIVRDKIIEMGLNCLSYCDLGGNPTDQYPMNPNGSELNCAGLSDPTGRVLGIMPHPEAYLSLYNHPEWPSMKRHGKSEKEEGEGIKIFRNIVSHIRKNKA